MSRFLQDEASRAHTTGVLAGARNHGASTPPSADWDYAMQGDDLAAVITALHLAAVERVLPHA